jgi:hypothetical protein
MKDEQKSRSSLHRSAFLLPRFSLRPLCALCVSAVSLTSLARLNRSSLYRHKIKAV